MNKQEIIRFREDKLITVKDTKGQVFIPLKQLCYYLNIDWEPQRKRINRDPVLKSTTFLMEVVALDGKRRKLVVLPLEYLNGFLFGISDSRIKDLNVKKKLLAYKKECYKVLHDYFYKGFALNEVQLKDPQIYKSAKKKLLENGPLLPLKFRSGNLSYTLLIENNTEYEKKVLKHSLQGYFDILHSADSNIELKNVKRRISRLAGSNKTKLSSIKGKKGRQNVYSTDILRAHFLSLPSSIRDPISNLGWGSIYTEVKDFVLANPNQFYFEGINGSISAYTDLLFEEFCKAEKNFLQLSNIVYIISCNNGNFYVGSHLPQLKERFPNHKVVKSNNFKCFLFLIQCNQEIGAREVEAAIFNKFSVVTQRPYEDFEKSGGEGFHLDLGILNSCIIDVFNKKKQDVRFIDGEISRQATQWVLYQQK